MGYFNPRPRKEGDTIKDYVKKNGDISIHALVKRATSFHCLYYNRLLYFNPRPRKEGDNRYGDRHGNRRDFNPRPRKEGDADTS